MTMKHTLAVALILALAFTLIGLQSVLADTSTWQPVSGPNGGSVAALAMSPDYTNDHTAFAGLSGRGVYRTSNSGFSWQSSGLSDQVIVDLAISPAYATDQTLFAAAGLPTTGYNVYHSNDGGQTWQLPDNAPDFQSITGLSISPNFASDHALYVIGASATYKSDDGGQTFFESGGWFGTHRLTHLVFSPAYATDHTLFAAVQNDRIYQSTDGGAHWTPTGLSGDISALAVSPNYVGDQTVAAVTTTDGQLHLSTNQGASWTPGTLTLGTGGQDTLLFSSTFITDHLMLAASSTDPGAYRSIDSGATWTPVGWYDPLQAYQGGFIGGSVFALAMSPNIATDGMALAGTSSGFYGSSNHGVNWYPDNNGLPRLTVRSLAVAPNDPNTLLAGTSFFEHQRFDTNQLIEADGNVQLSTNGGQTWQDVSGRLDRVQRVAFSPDFANDHTAFAISGFVGQHGYANGGIYRSIDGGKNWTAVVTSTVCSALALSPNYAVDRTAWVSAASGPLGPGILRTTNGGDSWTMLSSAVAALTIVPSSNYAVDQTLFASTSDNHVQKSVDGGQHWTPVLSDTITALTVSPAYGASQTLYAGVKETSGSSGDIYRTSDGGAAWQKLNTGIPAMWNNQASNISAIGFAADGSVMAGVTYGDGTSGAMVYRSIDGGQTWQALGSGLTAYGLFDLTSTSTANGSDQRGALTFYAGTINAVWRIDQQQVDPAEPGTWEMSGPYGGRSDVLVVSPNFANDGIAFTGEWNWFKFSSQYGRGIFKSTDWGQTWRAANNGLQSVEYPSGAVNGFAFSPNFATDHTVFEASWDGLFKSTDGGENWQLLDGFAPNTVNPLSGIFVAPNYPTSGHMLAQGTYGCLFRSTDFGAHWTPDCTLPFYNIAYSPNFAADNTIFASNGGIAKSIDGGLTWTRIFTAPTGGVVVSPQYATDHTLFTGGDALYKSTNGGTTWVSVTVGISNTSIGTPAISPAFATDHTLFVAAGNHLYRSDNGGLNWNLVPSAPDFPSGPVVISPGWPAQPYLLIGTARGVYRSMDGGATWALMPGLTPLDVSPLALSADESLWLAGTSNGMHASTDGGHTWFPFALQESRNSVSKIALSPAYSSDHTIFSVLAVPDGMGSSIYRTTDSGATWTRVFGTQAIPSLVMSPQYPTDHTIYAGTFDLRIVGSSDGGDHWDRIGTWPTSTTSYVGYVALPPNYPADSTIFAAGPGFWRLPPGETMWQPAASGVMTDATVGPIAVAPNYTTSHTLLAIQSWSDATNGTHTAVIRSDDGGVNWQPSNTGLLDSGLSKLAFSPNYADDHTVYLASYTQLYRSIDGGHSWTAFSEPPGAPWYGNLIVTRAGQLIATGTSVWRYTSGFRNILIDGDAEAGSGWSFSADSADYSERVTYHARHALRLGLDNGDNAPIDAYAIQTVTIPLSATLAQLNVRLYPASGEPIPTLQNRAATTGDAQYVTVIPSNTAAISHTLLWTLSNAQAWQRYSFDLTPYAGQTIELRFGVLNDGLGGQTAMYVDNASLITLGPEGSNVYLPVILKN